MATVVEIGSRALKSDVEMTQKYIFKVLDGIRRKRFVKQKMMVMLKLVFSDLKAAVRSADLRDLTVTFGIEFVRSLLTLPVEVDVESLRSSVG